MSGIMSMVLGARTAIAAAVDEFFNRVTLLLPGDGTNGAQNNTFLDSSSNGFSITRNPTSGPNATTQGTFSPFSQTGWSAFFNGSNDSLSLTSTTALSFGTGDFTIEFWIYRIGSNEDIVFEGRSTEPSVVPHVQVNASGYGLFYVNGSARITGTTVLATNTWHHIAVTRSGTSTRLFVNGTQEGSTYTDSNNYTIASTVYIGRDYLGSANAYLQGYLSNLRVVKGTAVYTSAFTPPTFALGPTSGGQNPPTGTQTSLLICQSNRFVDSGGLATPYAITVNNTPSVQAFSPFAPTAAYSAATNGGSGYFDGTGDYLTVGSNFSLGSGDFSIEGWLYCSSLPTNWRVLSQGTPTTGDFMLIGYSNGGADFTAAASSAIAFPSGSFAVNTWTHFAIVRSGTGTNNLKGYINGVNVVSATSTYNYSSTSNIYVGLNPNNTAQAFNGYVASLRISNNARTITVPTLPYSSDGNTRALLNFTNAGITDATAKNVLETVGNAQISTTQSKFGGASISFDGTGDWLLLPHTVDQMLGTGAFTIEMWIYRNASGTYGLVGKGTGTTGWLVSLNSSNQVVFTYGSSTITSTGTISATTWTYIAVVREGTGTNQTKIYISGSNDGTGTVSTDFNQTNAMYVGADRTGGSAFNGYIDDLRITKGYARTIATPSSAFALQ